MELITEKTRPSQGKVSTHRRRVRGWPSRRELRAVEIGADEIHARLEWALGTRPRALRAARRRYRIFCTDALSRLENNTRVRMW
jgi:hypothetical protein